MRRFMLAMGFGWVMSMATAHAACTTIWQQTFPATQRPFDGIHALEVFGSTLYAMTERTEGEVMLVSLPIGGGPATLSQVIELEPNRFAALAVVEGGAYLFDGYAGIVRVQAGEQGGVVWRTYLMKPPAVLFPHSLSAATDGILFAGEDVRDEVFGDSGIAVAVKLHADGTLAWRWRSEEFVRGRYITSLPDGGAALVALRADGNEVFIRLAPDGREVFRQEVMGEAVQIRSHGDEIAVLVANGLTLTLLSYDAQKGAAHPILLITVPEEARATELRYGPQGWIVTGSWPGNRRKSPEIPPESWIRSAETKIDNLPLYRPRVIGGGKIVGIRGSRLEVCE